MNVRCTEWIPEGTAKPMTYLSVLVWGFLLDEPQAATHEAYLVGKGRWTSVRSDEHGNHLQIADVTHWMYLPEGPALP